MKNYFIRTFGCQMNEHDSEKMEAFLRQEGFVRTETETQADLIVINTCSIREKSYQKALSEIGRIAKLPPTRTRASEGRSPSEASGGTSDEQMGGAGRRAVSPPAPKIVAVTGCVVSHDGANLLKRFPFVDIALGPDHIRDLPNLVREARDKKKRVARTDFADISDYEFPEVIRTDGEKKVTAYVTIMKGCDNLCSFCIVPFVRGKEVSRPSSEIVDEIQRLEEQGVREVMLLGQNVNSYGKRLSEKTSFAQLLRLIEERTTLSRLRFISPHPKDLSDALVEEYGRSRILCPHIHLPVQSGSNRVLKKMRRSYTRGVFLKKVEKIRRQISDIAITTDLIVGFPGETDRDFDETLSLVREVRFDASYSFVFSPRPSTEAAGFADDVSPVIKKERLARVQELQASISLEKNRSRIGSVEKVLVEGESREGAGQFTGRTPHGRIVNFDGDVANVGDILDIDVTAASAYSLKGVLCL